MVVLFKVVVKIQLWGRTVQTYPYDNHDGNADDVHRTVDRVRVRVESALHRDKESWKSGAASWTGMKALRRAQHFFSVVKVETNVYWLKKTAWGAHL